MTTQYAVHPATSGQTGLTLKYFASEESDTVLYTSSSMAERTNAKGQFLFSFVRVAVIPGGDYFGIVQTAGGIVVSTGWRTFAGTDGETATSTPITAVLDTDARVKLAAVQPDYAPARASDVALTVNPTSLSSESIAAIRSGLATETAVNAVTNALQLTLRGELTHSEAIDLIMAALIGKSSQPSSTTEKFKFFDDADAFITTFDSNGNRTAVALL